MANVSSIASRVLMPLRTVRSTVAANLFNQLVVALSQIIVIPLLVAKWGTDGLGTWLLLTAIPNYLTISDFGFTTSAKSDMAMRAARGDHAGAQITVSSVAAMLFIALVGIGAIYLTAAFIVDWVRLLNLSGLNNNQAQMILALGLIQIVGYQAFLLSASAIRAANMPTLEVMLSASFRLAETTAFVIAAFMGSGLVGAATAWAFSRLVATAVLWTVLYFRLPSLVPRIGLIDWSRVKYLLKPSLSYVTLPLANAISIQGTMLVLGASNGPVVAATFATSRIVTRLGVSAANVLNFAFVPQYSYSAGRGDHEIFRGLLLSHCVALLSGTALYIVFMLIFSNRFVSFLSHGEINANQTVLILLAAAAAFEMIWTFATSVGSALNRLGVMAITWLMCALVGVSALCIMRNNLDIVLVSSIVAATHATMLLAFFVWWKTSFQKTSDEQFGQRPSGPIDRR